MRSFVTGRVGAWIVVAWAFGAAPFAAGAQVATEATGFTVREGFVPMPSRAPVLRCDWARPTDGADAAVHVEQLLDVIGAQAGQVVADIGCGSGRLEPALARRVGEEGRIVARDMDAAVIARLIETAAKEGLTNIDDAVSTPDDVSVPRASVDLAVLCDVYQQVLRHQQDATRAPFLASLLAALKPGAVVVVLYDRAPENRGDEPAREQLLEHTLHDFVWAGFVPGRRWRIGADDKPVLAAEFARPALDAEPPWWDLSNGRDLVGWRRWLGPAASGLPPAGSDSDERRVFTMVMADGEPAIRVSGEVWGLLETEDEYADYEFALEFKWGKAVWPPLNARDSGILYHTVGPQGAVAVGGGALADPPGSGWFPRCFEMQLTEGDAGSFYCLGDVIADTRSATNDGVAYFKADGVERSVGPGHGPGAVIKQADTSRPIGKWNELTIRVSGDTIVHTVNGIELLHVTGTRRATKEGEVPLVGGRIGLQSESAEILFRHIRIRPFRPAAKRRAH